MRTILNCGFSKKSLGINGQKRYTITDTNLSKGCQKGRVLTIPIIIMRTLIFTLLKVTLSAQRQCQSEYISMLSTFHIKLTIWNTFWISFALIQSCKMPLWFGEFWNPSFLVSCWLRLFQRTYLCIKYSLAINTTILTIIMRPQYFIGLWWLDRLYI